MSGFCKNLRKLFTKIDFFGTNEFLRFREDSKYKTMTGGIVSLVIVTVIIVTSISTISDAINKTTVNWTATTMKIDIPPVMDLEINPSNFMIGFRLFGIDLNAQSRLFDVSLTKTSFVNTVVNETSEIPLVQCTTEHWIGFSNDYYRLKMNQWLCPVSNSTFSLQGKITSEVFKNLVFKISQCTNSSSDPRPCFPQAYIDSFMNLVGELYVIPTIINTMINPGNADDYLSSYLEDNNAFSFDRNTGILAGISLKNYHILSDNSLFLFSNFQNQSGIYIDSPIRSFTQSVSTGNYVTLFIQAATQTTSFSRSYNRIDSVASYIGGLIGSIVGVMFFMSFFTEMSFELKLAERLIKFCNDELDPNFKCFNFMSYMMWLFYSFLKSCRIVKGEWATMEVFREYHEEVSKHLDIEFLLQRVIFLERAMSLMFTQNQEHGYSYIFNHPQFKDVHVKNKKLIESGKLLRQLQKNSSQHSKILNSNKPCLFNFDEDKSKSPTVENVNFEENQSQNISQKQRKEGVHLYEQIKQLEDDENSLSKKIWSRINMKEQNIEDVQNNQKTREFSIKNSYELQRYVANYEESELSKNEIQKTNYSPNEMKIIMNEKVQRRSEKKP